jgi:hypothetical protein
VSALAPLLALIPLSLALQQKRTAD